tara:strand:- start:489 stop:941 length:453 start_codon:yes stop_codon:yes gene_type:complete
MARDHPLSLPKRRIPACALLSESAGGDLQSAATLELLSASLIKQAAFDFLAALTACCLLHSAFANTYHRSSHEHCWSHLSQTLAQSLQSWLLGSSQLCRAITQSPGRCQCRPDASQLSNFFNLGDIGFMSVAFTELPNMLFSRKKLCASY